MKLILEPETWQDRWQRRLFGPHARRVVCCAIVAVHVNLLAILGLAAFSLFAEMPSATNQVLLAVVAICDEEQPIEAGLDLAPLEMPEGLPLESDLVPTPALVPDAPEIPAPLPGQAAVAPLLPPDPSGSFRSPQTLLTLTDLKVGGGYEGRTAAARGPLAAARGGTPASEQAVRLGLVWLAAHQRDDGGWQFNHRNSKCAGQCSHPGTHQSTTAATSLALLAFLGAGQTHQDGEHQQVVARGLNYLQGRIVPSARGADLQEGTMYAQGLSTLALCEAYALSHDPQLQRPAQQALDFIVNVQHPLGGWRYFPGQPGDTTVLGWQLLALHSGRLAGLQVPERTFVRAHEFLDRVQSDQGATYGYQASGDQASGNLATPTAVGLLCRMHHGWSRRDERLRLGVERLAERGPDEIDLYYNYYATQVLHHYDGPRWETWNEQLREQLIKLQATTGHESGSWYTADFHTTAGGRLCDTALAVMILEVYYRHMPLYGYRSADAFW